MKFWQRISFCTVIAVLVVWPAGSSLGVTVSGRSSTVVEWFDTAEEETAIPVYQYLLLNVNQIQVDPQQIQQVFLNITSNTLQAMSKGGNSHCKDQSYQSSAMSGKPLTAPGYDSVKVAISDTGNVIPPENLKKVFQLLFTTKPRERGPGFPICQRILEQHGGTIYLEGEVGRGTTVIVRLPI